jgi:hypothetical protein
MSEREKWSQGNERYLSAALAWLRLRLERRMRPEPQPPAGEEQQPVAAPARGHGGGGGGGFFSHFRTASPAPDPAEPVPPSIEERLAAAAAEMEAAERAMDPAAPALSLLAGRLGLSEFERNVILLCAAMELDPDIAALCAAAQPGRDRNYPTFALARVLFDDPAWDAMMPEGPLRFLRLVEINQPGSQPLVTSGLRADERIVSFIKGLNFLDDRIAPLVSAVPPAGQGEELPPSQRHALDLLLKAWPAPMAAAPQDAPRFVQLIGPDEPGKMADASHAAAARSVLLYRMSVEALPSHAGDLETLARLWQRESLLIPLALYIDAQEADSMGSAQMAGSASSSAGGAPPALLGRFLERTRGTILLGTREPWPRLDSISARVEVSRPTAEEQRGAWAAELGPAAADLPLRLAGQFDMSLGAIRRAASAAADGDINGEDTDRSGDELAQRLWDACRDAVRPRMDALAQRLEPKATWDDLVVPEEQARLLRQIADQVSQRAAPRGREALVCKAILTG